MIEKYEHAVINLLVEAHNLFIKLEQTHPSYVREFQMGIHNLQHIIGMRILRRDYPETFVTIKQ